MSKQFCPSCGTENPGDARFCMACGHDLGREVPPAPPATVAQDRGTDWAAIVAAILAFLSLRRMSRRARGTIFVLLFLFLFFICPMVCGFLYYIAESILGRF